MKWYHYLYVSRRSAMELGFSHEARLFGVPAWGWENEDDPEMTYAVPKVPLLQAYTLLADCVFEVVSWFMPVGQTLESPVYLTKNLFFEEFEKSRSQLKV